MTEDKITWLTDSDVEEMEDFASEHGIVALLDHLGLDGLGNQVRDLYVKAKESEREDPLGEIHEMLEDMTPPELRLARQLLGQMGQLWDALVNQEARILQLEDDLLKALAKTERVKVVEGALEELIGRVDELRGEMPAPAAAPAEKPESKVAGIYCRNCAKRLTGKQKVFCTKKCAAVWHGQHRGQFATPRFEINEKPEATVVAGEGVRDNGKMQTAAVV